MIASINLKPSDFLCFYDNKVENNDFYAFKTLNNKINCIVTYHSTYFFMNCLNKIILGEDVIFSKPIKYYGKWLNLIKKEKSIFIIKIIECYNDKDYNNLCNILMKYYSVYEYDLSKSMLVFLYVSAEKIGKDINFLPEITKQKMYNTVNEEEFRQFVEKELS